MLFVILKYVIFLLMEKKCVSQILGSPRNFVTENVFPFCIKLYCKTKESYALCVSLLQQENAKF